MSIIYATLERLEAQSPSPVAGQAQTMEGAAPVTPVEASPGLPLKALALALAVVGASAGLVSWNAGQATAEPPRDGATAAAVVAEKAVGAAVAAEAAEAAETAQAIETVQAVAAVSGDAASDAALATADHSTGAVPLEGSGDTGVAEASAAHADVDDEAAIAPEATVATLAANPVSPVSAEELVPPPAPRIEAAAQADTGEASSSGDGEPVVTVATVPAEGAPEASDVQVASAAPAAVEASSRVVTAGPVPGSVDAVLEEARTALSRGQYANAVAALETLAPVPRQRADFWLIKGSAHLALGQLGLAGEAFSAARALAPDNAQIAVQEAILLQEQGDHGAAVQLLRLAAERHPMVPEVFLNLGYSQQVLGDLPAAGHSFRIFLNMTGDRSLYAHQREVVAQWLAQVDPGLTGS